MEDKEYIIVFAPAGSGLRGITDKLSETGEDFLISDIEEILCKDLPATQETLKDFPTQDKITMYDVTWNLPRNRIDKLWTQAVEMGLHKFCQKSNTSTINTLTGHIVYYCGKRDEYYSVFNVSYLTKLNKDMHLNVSHVILFVDDIFDMYHRLSSKNQLYSPGDRISDFEKQIEKERNLKLSDLSAEEKACIYTEWETGVLLHMLTWRHLEILFAENLAAQLNTSFMVFGLKNIMQGVLKWLDKRSLSVYVSHPISEVRRQQIKTGQWPEIEKQLKDLQIEMYKYNLVCIMPTSIDEYRFCIEQQKYTGYLDDRWPLASNISELFYVLPERVDNIDYSNLLETKHWDSNKKAFVAHKIQSDCVNIFVNCLVRQIQLHIASRDHLLVSHTDNLLIFRPFYGKKRKLSEGVEKEIEHWATISKSQEKRALFIHFKSDVIETIGSLIRNNDVNFPDWIRREMAEIFRRDYPINDKEFYDLVDQKMNSSTVGGTTLSPPMKRTILSQIPSVRRKAKRNILNSLLSGSVAVADNSLGMLIVENEADLQNFSKRIVYFLQGAIILNTLTDELADEMLNDSLFAIRE